MTSLERLTRFVVDLRYELVSVLPENKLTLIKQRLATLPAEERRIAEDLILMGADAMNPEVWKQKRAERWAAFAFGVVFVTAILVVAVVIPNPTPTQYQVFRIILAGSMAGALMFVPGFLDVQVGKSVRAGGALAVFVIVYFWSPAQLAVSSVPP